jgi:hypothetical protein
MTRYLEYQARLAAQPVGEIFDRAATFLLRAWNNNLSQV